MFYRSNKIIACSTLCTVWSARSTWTPTSTCVCVCLVFGCCPLLPLERKLISSTFNDIVDQCVPPICGNSLGNTPSCFDVTVSPCTKWGSIKKWISQSGVEQLDWPARSPDIKTPSKTLGMNCNADCEPDLLTQHQRWTSLTLLRLNGSRSPKPCSNILWNAWNHKSGGCYSSRIMPHGSGMRFSKTTCGCNVQMSTYFWPYSLF